ncbi:gas vesicle protein [Streptomyces sp. HPF1205]|uniref:gas vesicle protein GvpO n=1 Tax=Streptomyces sp. HPF1205 TaxID=2873262 RepID=UPI001CEC4DA0|nr:gas vesicle protein [Streptomyces sp. HPF1205]
MAERHRAKDGDATAGRRREPDRDDRRRERREPDGSHETERRGAEDGEAPGTGRTDGPAVSASVAVRRAARQVVELIGREPEGVTSVARTAEGWRVGIEVVETRRVPNSTDVLAVYRVDLDGDGELISYERDRRYYRGRADKE